MRVILSPCHFAPCERVTRETGESDGLPSMVDTSPTGVGGESAHALFEGGGLILALMAVIAIAAILAGAITAAVVAFQQRWTARKARR